MNTNHEFVGIFPIQESMEQLIIELVRAGLIDFEDKNALNSEFLTDECP
ncbi:hypothetical protein [Paenibacillus sp.]